MGEMEAHDGMSAGSTEHSDALLKPKLLGGAREGEVSGEDEPSSAQSLASVHQPFLRELTALFQFMTGVPQQMNRYEERLHMSEILQSLGRLRNLITTTHKGKRFHREFFWTTCTTPNLKHLGSEYLDDHGKSRKSVLCEFDFEAFRMDSSVCPREHRAFGGISRRPWRRCFK